MFYSPGIDFPVAAMCKQLNESFSMGKVEAVQTLYGRASNAGISSRLPSGKPLLEALRRAAFV